MMKMMMMKSMVMRKMIPVQKKTSRKTKDVDIVMMNLPRNLIKKIRIYMKKKRMMMMRYNNRDIKKKNFNSIYSFFFCLHLCFLSYYYFFFGMLEMEVMVIDLVSICISPEIQTFLL